VELQGLKARCSARPLALLITLTFALAAVGGLVLTAAPAASASQSGYVEPGQPYPVSAPPGTADLVSSMTKPPAGYRLNGDEVLAIAKRNPLVIHQLSIEKGLRPLVYTRGSGIWQVSWFSRLYQSNTIERLQLYVDDATGVVTQAWTGYQVPWTMARGYTGAFGRRVNALYIWIPLCVLFLAPFLTWRRRPTLLHLDLLVLLGFSASLAWFNHANIGLSAPSIYPFMIYLLVRMLLLANGIGRPKGPLRLALPVPWLAIGIVFLIGFRIGLNVTDSNVIDVGYAGVIGGYKITHGQKLYGENGSVACSASANSTKDCWPSNNGAGDTYGPVNYYAYVPAVALLGWSGVWDTLPAAHAAAIAFDLLTMLALFLLGRQIRGPTLGTVLAYLWAAYPFTLYTMSSNSNDTLVALLIVLSLLAVTSAPARGIMGAFAGLTKFGPLALGPLLLRGTGPFPRKRSIAVYVIAYGLALLVPMLPVLLSHDWHNFWQDTIVYQTGRPAPFSLWGIWGGGGYHNTLKVPLRIWQGLTVALAFSTIWFPRGNRSVVQVAALGGAIMIAVQCSLMYWIYLYIPWFYALVIVALIASHPPGPDEVVRADNRTVLADPIVVGT
jgi:hypothetical protein